MTGHSPGPPPRAQYDRRGKVVARRNLLPACPADPEKVEITR
jgi:hypothetical protein